MAPGFLPGQHPPSTPTTTVAGVSGHPPLICTSCSHPGWRKKSSAAQGAEDEARATEAFGTAAGLGSKGGGGRQGETGVQPSPFQVNARQITVLYHQIHKSLLLMLQ